MTDTQIVNESFLEDINNVLNTGEITNLYDEDDFTKIVTDIVPYARQLGRIEQRDVLYQTYIERVWDIFHIILCMSPVGDQLRIRCWQFPSLVNCCTLDWYDSWSESALHTVASKFIYEIEDLNADYKEKLARMCMYTHLSVEKMTHTFYDELRRKVYTTPKSYLDGIYLYKNKLQIKRKELKENIERLSTGLKTLDMTNQMV